MNRIWKLDFVFNNLLCAQQKLISRERIGAKVVNRHDQAATPLQRLVDSGTLSPQRKGTLTKKRNNLHPGQLQRQITGLLEELQRISLTKAPTRIRRVNRAFNAPLHPEVLGEAMNRRSRRI